MTVKSKFIKNSRGQGLLEALSLALALMTFISVLCGTLYFSVVHVGLNYLLHEHLVCEHTQGAKRCRQIFLDRSKVFLVFAHLQNFSCQQAGPVHKARAEVLMPFHRRMVLQKEMALYR